MVVAALAAPALAATTIPDAALVLEVTAPPRVEQVAEAMPPRFVLLENGTVFVGGTSEVMMGRLSSGEVKDLDKQIERVRKLPGLTGTITLGPGATRYHLGLRKGGELVATGDPSQAPAALRPLAALLERLLSFDHPSLRPYRPGQYLLSARPASIVGGCRAWSFPVPIDEVLGGPKVVPAEAATEWPTGATAASVCSGDRTFEVALRPLLVPGEKP
jgi:hypothetical protein